MSTPLTDSEMRTALGNLPGWITNGKAIERKFEFKDFKDAMAFTNRIAMIAEEANHHPNIEIIYNKLKLTLVSHDAGGVTNRDLKMAARINEIAG
jgi:4a-hydroxytetrahydrobiopterin dehydratase